MEQMLLAKKDEAGFIHSNKQNDFFLADAAQMEELKKLSANICMMVIILPANIKSDEGPSYDFAYISEVQTPSTSYMNPLFTDNNHEQTYHEQPKIINSTIDDDQINSNIIFDDPNVEVNSGSVEHDKNVHDSYELEQLARNAYKEAEKRQMIANKVKQQNVVLTKKHVLELQNAQTVLKHKLNANEDKYLDDVLNLEEKMKKNENVVIKMSQYVQALFMLRLKPLLFYDPKLKHGLGYENPYTLKKVISQNPKLYDASCLHSSKVHVNVCDTEEILEDATKNQIKIENKLKDLIAIEKKQNFHSIDYKKLNALYETFVPQVKLSAEQKYLSSVSTTSETFSNASTSSSPPTTMPNSSKPLKHFYKMETKFENFDLDATSKQNEILNDQLLEATLKHDVEKCELMCSDFVNVTLLDEIEKVKRESIDDQENLNKRIKILEYDKLENDNVSLEFKVQSLIKEHENIKLECQKLFDSIKKTRTQSQKEINELIENVNQKTYAYRDVRAKNQDLLIIISELKEQLKNAKKDDTSVRRPSSRDSSSKNNVLLNTKNHSEREEVHVRTNKKTNVASKKNVFRNRKIVTNVDVKHALKAKDVLCVFYGKNVLTLCHYKCLAKYKLNVHSKVRRALFTTPRTAKPNSVDTTSVVTKTRFTLVTPLSVKNKDSTAFRSTLLFAKEISLSKYTRTEIKTSRKWQKWYETQPNVGWSPNNITANTSPTVVKSRTNVVIQIVLWIIESVCSKHMTGYLKLLKNFVEKFIGTICFGNNHFAAIIGYGDYIHGNITICHAYYVEGLGHNLFIVGKFCDGARKSNLYTISISDMTASSAVCLMSKATLRKSWLWHQRLSHLNFGTINDLTKQDLVDGLSKFKYDKDHQCFAYERGKSKKATHPLKLVPSTHSKLELIHMDLCRPIRVESINGKMPINSAAQITLHNQDTHSLYSIIIEDNEAPPLVSSSEEQISPILNDEADELIQEEDFAELDRNTLLSLYHTLMFKEVESSLTAEDLQNMQVITLVQPSTHV
ncbi:integrase, catalytic region, zinc finger, CCHC-type containing protein [Tanacetum coccineum]|uniref:Integrase, catalytic region, zinc finger, CCHC-type containing protein n=1 Tax=Tanacetum coccineum TaxID=301880 RepID=A0ABQ5CER6_9ASTR